MDTLANTYVWEVKYLDIYNKINNKKIAAISFNHLINLIDKYDLFEINSIISIIREDEICTQ